MEIRENLMSSAKISSVELASLRVDESYQRGLKNHHRRIAAEFDPEAAGLLTVGCRPDLTNWVIDGQQRRAAMVILGITHWPARIITSSGSEYEARIYQILNGGRGTVKKLNSRDLFRSQMVARDPVAIATQNAVEAAGLKMGSHGGHTATWPYLGCVRGLYLCTNSYGEDVLRKALIVIKTCWEGSVYSLTDFFVRTLVALVANPAVDLTRLTSQLKKVSALSIYEKTLAGGGTNSAKCYAVMAKQYNKGLKTRKIKESLAIYHNEDQSPAEEPVSSSDNLSSEAG